MTKKSLEEIGKNLLKLADIKINGNRPWDIQVKNPKFYERVVKDGSIGLGESYMDRWWDCQALDQFFDKLLSANLNERIKEHLSLKIKMNVAMKFIIYKLTNSQNIRKSKKVAEQHYNLGNDFYFNMLDKEFMQYTCGYWKDSENLQQAQINKLNLICRKLHLQKKTEKNKNKILELGSGFGGFALFAAKNYNCEITSYNISKEQIDYAREKSKNLPIKIIESDYRKALNPKNKNLFDRIVSIGMMEHVGPKNYKKFMKLANYCLKDKGLFLVHTIGSIKTHNLSDPWIIKYIFPGGHLPSASQITKAGEPYFHLEDVQNFGHYYDQTLMAWFENFDKNWPKFKDQYDEKFYRMWKYYLLSCAGAFRSGNVCLFQFVFSKRNFGKTYEGIR
jgi:cyclopropane-fatty-acyl-phospholipid synthase